MDKKVIQTIIEEIGVNSPAVLATIVNVSGSVPRHEGAQMLIFLMDEVWGLLEEVAGSRG